MFYRKTTSDDPLLLTPGCLEVFSESVKIVFVVGSAVVVCVHDRRRKTTGAVHFLYPWCHDPARPNLEFGNVAIAGLVNYMKKKGSRPEELGACLFGGAHDPACATRPVGPENVAAAEKILARKGVAIMHKDVGGTQGRKVVFDCRAVEAVVVKTPQIRAGDWYPYAARA